jgi:hypothetical protein
MCSGKVHYIEQQYGTRFSRRKTSVIRSARSYRTLRDGSSGGTLSGTSCLTTIICSSGTKYILRAEALGKLPYQHAIPIAEKTVPLLNGFPVCFENKFATGKRGHQHQER